VTTKCFDEFLANVNSPERLSFGMGGVGLPLVAGMVGSRLQGSAMNSKENALRKAGYDYGDTLWGTGEGWGQFSSVGTHIWRGHHQTIISIQMNAPGYAGIGGSGCYSNHIDLLRNDDDEEQLKDVEDHVGLSADPEEAVEEATYQLSKNTIDDNQGESYPRYDESDDKSKSSDDDDPEDDILSQVDDDLQMIDSDGE
jgi:hypothetical protein